MKRKLKALTSLLAILCMSEDAFAASGCVRREEMTALRVAAVQQQLMVAALSCNAISRYNGFVINYRRELQGADDTLKQFFERMSGSLADYHAFKTRLANQSSLRMVVDGNSYCREAAATFDMALNSDRLSLEQFVYERQIVLDVRYPLCNRTAALAARIVSLPKSDEDRDQGDDGFVTPRDHNW